MIIGVFVVISELGSNRELRNLELMLVPLAGPNMEN